jgi:hypothetical protein
VSVLLADVASAGDPNQWGTAGVPFRKAGTTR